MSEHPAALVKPKRLQPGDRIAIIAPAGPVPREPFEAGLALLSARYETRYSEALFTRTGFLAGDDDRRLAELLAALADPAVRAIICARGGHGTLRLLPRLPASVLRSDPRLLVGFSDITALHAAWFRAGLVSLHAPVVTQLARLAGGAAELCARLEDSAPAPPWTGLTTISDGAGGPDRQGGPGRSRGVAEGVAIGGNLEVLTRLLGTPWFPVAEPCVLFIEEIGERPYRLDRQLAHLRLAGVFDRVSAIVVGELNRCDEPDGTVRGEAVVRDALGSLGVPVVGGAPFGHGDINRPFVHGGRVRVDASAGRVEFLDGAVS